MKILFHEIPIDQIILTLAVKENTLSMLALYIAAAQELGFSTDQLAIHIQTGAIKNRNSINDIALLFTVLNYCRKHLKRFQSVMFTGSGLQEAGLSIEKELAYTLSYAKAYLNDALIKGDTIESVAPQISFHWSIGAATYNEIAKMRSARMLWAKIVASYQPKNFKELGMKAHCSLSKRTFTANDSHSNLVRATFETITAVLGGMQSLDTHSAINGATLQHFLQEETKICQTVDPLGGSYYLESLTEELTKKAWLHIEALELKESLLYLLTTALEETAKETKDLSQIFVHQRDEIKTVTALSNLQEAVEAQKEDVLIYAIIAATQRATLTEINHILQHA